MTPAQQTMYIEGLLGEKDKLTGRSVRRFDNLAAAQAFIGTAEKKK